MLLLSVGSIMCGQEIKGATATPAADTVEVHSFSVRFPVASSRIVESFSTNAETLSRLRAFVDSINNDSLITISRVAVVGSASPEGNHDYNVRLVDRRINALVQYINTLGHFPQIERINRGPDRDSLRALQAENPAPNRRYYPQLRYSTGEFTIHITSPHIEIAPVETETVDEPEPEPEPAVVITPTEPLVYPAPVYGRRWYVKSNAIGWAMLAGNIAVEADMSQRLSLSVPVYFSALNYFTSRVKFRTAMVQPELRYWFDDLGPSGHTGWFAGVHAGVGHFNMALGGDTRIQDTDGRHPAVGGGLSAGWRKDIGRNGRWKLEFSLGVGAYYARYDKYQNRPQGYCLEKDRHTTFVGIDKATVSIVYTFGKIK